MDNFQKSINKYLKENMYQNPSSDKLYSYFNEFANGFANVSQSNKIQSYLSINYVDFMNKLIRIKGYPILFVSIKDSNLLVEVKTFNLDLNKLSDFPIDIYIGIKFFTDNNDPNNFIDKTIPLKSKQVNKININFEKQSPNIIINPNNNLFCIIKYVDIRAQIEKMYQAEIMKYIHDEFILYLYGYNSFNEYFESVSMIFDKLDLVKNNLLLVTILTDLNRLFYLNKYFDCVDNSEKFLNKISNKLVWLIDELCKSDIKYMELVFDQIFITLTIYFKNQEIFSMVTKIYQYQINLHNCNLFYMSKSVFEIMMLNSQSVVIDKFIEMLSFCTNVQIVSNIIESFSYLDSTNFDKVFLNYKNLLRSQDYGIFFSSVSKIKEKQEFLINYWIESNDEISQIEEIRFKILKNMCVNIYQSNLIDKLIQHIKIIYLQKYQIIFDKITDILETNKIISNTIKK